MSIGSTPPIAIFNRSPRHACSVRGAARTRALLGLAMLLPIMGCAAREAGLRGAAAFDAQAVASVIRSARNAQDLAACFEARGGFLPFSRFTPLPGGGRLYRLEIAGWRFEEIAITPVPGGGAQATVRLAPNLDGRWHATLAQDRLAPLAHCATDSGLR